MAVGHATQLTRLGAAGVRALAAAVRARGLPVHLVGLPMSDVYMMGRKGEETEAEDESFPENYRNPQNPLGSLSTLAPRGTLNIPMLLRAGLSACLGVNNVGNAFTPHGTGDPLQMACFGVGLYHAGTGEDARALYGAVSWGARAAIGVERDEQRTLSERSEDPSEDPSEPWWKMDPPALVGRFIGPVLVFANEKYIQLPDDDQPCLAIPARRRTGFRDVVWDPPDVSLRKIIH